MAEASRTQVEIPLLEDIEIPVGTQITLPFHLNMYWGGPVSQEVFEFGKDLFEARAPFKTMTFTMTQDGVKITTVSDHIFELEELLAVAAKLPNAELDFSDETDDDGYPVNYIYLRGDLPEPTQEELLYAEECLEVTLRKRKMAEAASKEARVNRFLKEAEVLGYTVTASDDSSD